MEIKILSGTSAEPMPVFSREGSMYFSNLFEVKMAAEINGKFLEVSQVLSLEEIAKSTHERIIGDLRRALMREIEKRLFNDFNYRTPA